MYAFPEVGSCYWHGASGYRVDSIDRVGDEIRVNLLIDPEWEEELLRPLPDGYRVEGGRSSDDERWHFQVRDSENRVVGKFLTYRVDLESALNAAIEQALPHITARADPEKT